MAVTFRELFPAPENIALRTVGMDLSDDTVKGIELLRSDGHMRLGRYFSQQIPEGVLSQGVVKDRDGLSVIFSELKKKYSLDAVSVSLPEEQGYLVHMQVPALPDAELRSAIELQLEEHVPIPASEAVFDFEVFREVGEGNAKVKEVSVSVLPRATVDSYLGAFDASGLLPVVLNVEAQATARAVIPRGETGAFMIVDFGCARTSIAIVSNGMVWFTSTIPVGGDHLTDIVAKGMNVPREKAVQIKESRGLSREIENKEIFSLLAPSISVLRDEINKHYSYWQSRRSEEIGPRTPIEALYFTGGGANLSGLLDYLSYDFEVPVSFANVWANVKFFPSEVPAIHFNESLGFAPAIGMAIYGFGTKNERAISI